MNPTDWQTRCAGAGKALPPATGALALHPQGGIFMRISAPARVLARAAAVLALTLSMAAGTTGLLSGAEAHALPVTEGSLAFSGDEGDWISGGQSYAYSTSTQDRLNISADTAGNGVHLSVDGANGDWWYLDLTAPSGQTLAPGT